VPQGDICSAAKAVAVGTRHFPKPAIFAVRPAEFDRDILALSARRNVADECPICKSKVTSIDLGEIGL